MMVREGPKHVGVKYTLQHFVFLMDSAFVGNIFLYLSKCTVKKQQLKLNTCNYNRSKNFHGSKSIDRNKTAYGDKLHEK
jgi:hypothetical protein